MAKRREYEKLLLENSYYRMFIDLEDDIKNYIKYQDMIQNANDEELIQDYTEGKYDYLYRIKESVRYVFGDNMHIVDDDEGRLNYSVIQRYFVDNEIRNKLIEINDGNILHILQVMKNDRTLYNVRYASLRDNYYEALGFDKEEIDNKITEIRNKFQERRQCFKDKEDGRFNYGIHQDVTAEEDSLVEGERRFDKDVRYYEFTGIVPSAFQEVKVTRYLNHEILGRLSVFKNSLNAYGKNEYTLLKVHDKNFQPYVVAYCLDEKDGRWQQGTYFDNYLDAENCFRIKTELNNYYDDVLNLLHDYNEYLNTGIGGNEEKIDTNKLVYENNYEISLMGTTIEESEEDWIQMTYDLKTNTFKYYLNEKLIAQEKYYLDDLRHDLSYGDFDIFYRAILDKVDEYKSGVEVDGVVFFRDDETEEFENNADSEELLKERVAQKLNALMYDYNPYEYGDNELSSSPVGLNGEGNNYDMCLDMLDKKDYSKIDTIIADISEDSDSAEFEDRINDLNNDLKTLKGLQIRIFRRTS